MSICGLAYLGRSSQQRHHEHKSLGDLHGTDPDDLDTKRLNIVEFLDDAGDVSDAVIVAVVEGRRIDLIDCGILPPRSDGV